MNKTVAKYLTDRGVLFSFCLICLLITARAQAQMWDFNDGTNQGWTVEFSTDPGAESAWWYDGANYSGDPAIGRPPFYGPLDAFDGSNGSIRGFGDDDSISVFYSPVLAPQAMDSISARFIITGLEYGIPASLAVHGQVGYKRVGSTSYFFGANFPLDRVIHTAGLYAYPLWTRASMTVPDGVMVTQVIVRVHVEETPWGVTYNFIDNVTSGGCPHPVGHLDYCSDPACGPCAEGEGDCDNHEECAGDLICDFVPGTDYCRSDGGCTLPVGHSDYCRDPACGPCSEGEGDCDSNSECAGDLICDFVPGTDYCRSDGGCTLPVDHSDYCSDPACGPCGAGEGDCDSNSECQSGLSCVFVPGTDVCCPHPLGHLDYCRDCGPCRAGQGDCDSDAECQSGLTCAFVPGTDTCQ